MTTPFLQVNNDGAVKINDHLRTMAAATHTEQFGASTATGPVTYPNNVHLRDNKPTTGQQDNGCAMWIGYGGTRTEAAICWWSGIEEAPA
ncbi:hypothetical protein Y032_0502g2620 [Ancylostoma ceylanicum]|nr:hypothetical protein Y032_0502g2620 [Ancylostoma ceylanicum]